MTCANAEGLAVNQMGNENEWFQRFFQIEITGVADSIAIGRVYGGLRQ